MDKIRFTSFANDLFAEFNCTCTPENYKAKGMYFMKTTIKISGYNDAYFFDTVNEKPRTLMCHNCGKQYSYQWKRDGIEIIELSTIPVHSEDECNSTKHTQFFNFKAIYHDGVGDTLQSILDAIENNKPHSFMELWQAANRSSYIAIFDGLAISADDGRKEIRFAVHIESHGDFKEATIHHTDFVDFCNQIVFNQPKRTWMDLGYSIDENYYVPIYSDWVYKSEEYNIKVV